MAKKIGIVLVNYKNYAEKYLSECRESLKKQTYPSFLFETYVVDNFSSEESRNYLKEKFPEAKILPRKDGNYSAANNLGAKEAIKNGCDYIVVANMDTKFSENWLLELVKGLEKDDKIGIAQSKILLYPQNKEEWKNPKINSLGNIIHFLGFGFTSGYGQKDREILGNPEILYASGCSFIIKKEVFEKIGGYNEEYYMYHDDLELSWKAKLAGYKIVLAPKSVVYHKYEFSRSVKMIYFMERNRYLAMFHFYKLATVILIFPFILLLFLAMLAYSVVNGWFGQYLKVCAYFLNPKSWLKIIKQRKFIKSLRLKKDREIIKDFSGRIDFQEIDNSILKYIANPILDTYWQIVKKIIFW